MSSHLNTDGCTYPEGSVDVFWGNVAPVQLAWELVSGLHQARVVEWEYLVRPDSSSRWLLKTGV